MRRLVGFILIFALFLIFIVLNLDNRCDVSFGFYIAKDLPVFITAFGAFFLGLLCAVPFAISLKKIKPKDPVKPPKQPKLFGKKSAVKSSGEGENELYGID
jgi:uncharacterized integral membrane protein